MRVKWTVRLTKRAQKQLNQLPENIQRTLYALARELNAMGPVQGSWPNYSKLTGRDRHHCHLNYRFVAVWEVVDREIRLIEVTYVGSRKDAPY
ncbi:cytotoxic translational repressor of toxin-antitoxin stability system [Bdellovibrionota bacterium FG-2]